MGGNSALNAGKQLAFIRGLIMLAPYDPTVYLKLGKEAYIKALLNEGKILKSDGIDSIYEDIVQNKENLAFPNAFDGVKDKNILIFAAKYDTVSNNEEMILPLWKKLEANKTAAIQKLIEYPVQHGLLGRRILMIREIAEFIKESGE